MWPWTSYPYKWGGHLEVGGEEQLTCPCRERTRKIFIFNSRKGKSVFRINLEPVFWVSSCWDINLYFFQTEKLTVRPGLELSSWWWLRSCIGLNPSIQNSDGPGQNLKTTCRSWRGPTIQKRGAGYGRRPLDWRIPCRASEFMQQNRAQAEHNSLGKPRNQDWNLALLDRVEKEQGGNLWREEPQDVCSDSSAVLGYLGGCAGAEWQCMEPGKRQQPAGRRVEQKFQQLPSAGEIDFGVRSNQVKSGLINTLGFALKFQKGYILGLRTMPSN